MDDLLYGRHTVAEALRAGRAFLRILIAANPHDPLISEIIETARQRGITYQLTDRRRLDSLCRGSHQGVIALAAGHSYATFEDILDRSDSSGPRLLVVLDGIQDPHNLGAIIRTAGATGVHGVIIPKRRSVGLTGAVAKASAGAVERVPVAQVPNVASGLKILKSSGFWIVGLGADYPELYSKVDYAGHTALVIGAEGRGIRPVVERVCDHLVRIPMASGSESLNASVAAALALYEVFRQREWS